MRDPARRAHRGDRRVGLGQVVARVRHALRRGAASLRRVDVDLRAAVPRAHAAARRRRVDGRAAGDRHRAAQRRAQRALHRRHGHRDLRLPAAAVRARRRGALPELRRRWWRATPAQAAARRACSRGGGRARARDRARARRPRRRGHELVELRATASAGCSSTARSSSRRGRSRALRALRILPLLVDRLSRRERARLADALRARRSRSAPGAPRCTSRAAPSRCASTRATRCSALRPRRCARPSRALFSFNSPLGACETCQGFGRVIGIDLDKVIPDARKTLREGAIAPFQTPSNAECQDDLSSAPRKRSACASTCRGASSRDARARAGSSTAIPTIEPGGWQHGQWYGVRGFFRYLEIEEVQDARARAARALSRLRPRAPSCEGTRLRAEALAVRVGGRIDRRARGAAGRASCGRCSAAVCRAAASRRARPREPLLREIDVAARLPRRGRARLPVARSGRRARSRAARRSASRSRRRSGAQLTGTLYVLDEPSVGLHPRDSHRLLARAAQAHRARQHRGGRRARSRDHARGRSRHRSRPRRRRARRRGGVRRHATPSCCAIARSRDRRVPARARAPRRRRRRARERRRVRSGSSARAPTT